MTRTLLTACLLGASATSYAQTITNPDFDDACTFDMTGWSWFCSVPDFTAYLGQGDCNSLMLPTSDAFSPCFNSGQLVGVHTLLNGVQAGVPYALSLWHMSSEVNLISDVGLFAYAAGQTPTSFASTTPLPGYIWPLYPVTSYVWQQHVFNFTILPGYAGMDFYLFLEYSAAPDPMTGTKMFDDFTLTQLIGTSAPEADDVILAAGPNPVEDRLTLTLAEAPQAAWLIDATGREHALVMMPGADRSMEVDVRDLPAGVFTIRITGASGTVVRRFVKA